MNKFSMRYELAHHGIQGMKWGKKNGPPYPLNYSDLSPEEREHHKEKAIREGNITEAAKNKVHFSDQELRAVKERYKLNLEVNQLSAAAIKSGMDKVDDLMNNIGKMTKWAEKSVSAYNVVAKIANSLGDSDLPMIKDSKPDNGKSYVDVLELEDGTRRTITVKNAKDKDIRNMAGYKKKKGD